MQKSSQKPIEIKISTVVAISAILHTADLGVLGRAMAEMTGGMPDFFDDEFAVIDVGALDGAALDWTALVALLKSHRLNAVAVRNAPEHLQAGILAHGLSIDAGGKPAAPAEPVEAPAPVQAAIACAPEPAPATVPVTAPAMIVDTPVRAGQRIYARGADLIITAVVNNGAEVIADGSIHVYAPLRGRALAGASGDGSARIFALAMEPELVSVAGVYKTFDDGFPADLRQRPAQVRLVDDRLDMRALALPGRA